MENTNSGPVDNVIVKLGPTHKLSIQDVVHVARSGQKIAALSDEDEERVRQSATWVENVVEEIESRNDESLKEAKAYYGINTGFGALAGKTALKSEYLTRVLSRNLIASHSVGVGNFFDEETVRAAMLIRAQTLAQGYSGVRPLLIQKLIDMLNRRAYPAVPSKGSLGSSGDLAPLSHLALVISKVPGPHSDYENFKFDNASGEAFLPLGSLVLQNQADESKFFHITEHRLTGEQTLWRRVNGEQAMAQIGGQIELRAKEGVALINGTTFSAALAALTVHDAWNALENAEIALAMTLEAVRGFRDPFFPKVHEVRGHRGAQISAANIMRYVQGSELLDPGAHDKNPERVPPQDPYSIRCAPQVIGAVRDTLEFVQRLTETELNAATDNPLIFMDLPRDYKTVSGGNFHGEPIAMAMDFLGIAASELGNIAERRIFKLTDPNDREKREYGLEPFLMKQEKGTEGLNSGFMLLQYTAASLISDCKTLAHPDSVDSIPSSANQEDHVSMSLNAARHAREIVDNIEAVIAIELLCAAQALELRMKNAESKRMGAGTRAAFDRFRKEIEYLSWDRVLYPDIRAAIKLLRSGELVRLARTATKS